MDIKKVIENITVDVNKVADPALRTTMSQLLNIVEFFAAENEALKEENQRLRDENNRLKGEQGKPDIRKQTKANEDVSSEQERKKKKSKRNKKSKKKDKLTVNRIEHCQLDKNQLPPDVIFKGYQDVIVQDIVIRTDNIKFKKAIYYSPSFKKTFIAPLPAGYAGEFGPHVRTLILSLYYKSKMTESALLDFLIDQGIFISSGTISNILINQHEVFHREKENVVRAGLQSTVYQQMDDTGARVKGKNYYAHVLCNEFYTAYFTRRHKDRLTILGILSQSQLEFSFSEQAFALMKEMNLPAKTLAYLSESAMGQFMNQRQIENLLIDLFPDTQTHQTARLAIVESTAIAAYQAAKQAVKLLLTDDAPQYNKITEHHPLCWVHDGRHYKRLSPVMLINREKLENFITQYWGYYEKLLAYKSAPTSAMAETLSNEFDCLFSTKTGYDKLDERIAKTKEHKVQLLLVLQYPMIPLHNNDSELGARDQGRRRDISFHTMSVAGTEAKDTFMTLAQTAKKMTVNFYHYLLDRIHQTYEMPSLAELIAQKSLA
jgi:Transposase IS66 family